MILYQNLINKKIANPVIANRIKRSFLMRLLWFLVYLYLLQSKYESSYLRLQISC